MSKVVDFQKIVRQAAVYGAMMKQLPLQVEAPETMDVDEQLQYSAAVNSIYAHMKALNHAGVDSAAIAMSSIAATAAFVAMNCPEEIRPKFVECCVDSFKNLVANTQIVERKQQ